MVKLSSESILRTLCYSDIFDFPLTKFELSSYLIKSSGSSQAHKNHYRCSSGYYYLRGRKRLVPIRKKRESHSKAKRKRARQVLRFLRFLPSVQLIAITGAVAANNAKQDDDIDVMIVTTPRWLWTTRFVIIVLADILHIRRRPHDVHVSDKFCFNMFLDTRHMAVPQKEQDLFSANEIAHMKILWGRGDIKKRFYYENRWIKKYLPTIHYSILNNQSPLNTQQSIVNPIEFILKHVQLFIMRSKRTSEVIKDGYLRFHPRDARKWIMKEYTKRLRKYGLE